MVSSAQKSKRSETAAAHFAREVRVRRLAERRGYRLEKSRRDPRAVAHGGYWLLEDSTFIVLGAQTRGHSSTLDEIEAFLNRDK